MVTPDPFLPTLDVMVDEGCQAPLPPEVHPGPRASLRRSEVIPLGLCGQGPGFPRDRAFSRAAQRPRRSACPTLPHRTPFKRLLRQHSAAIVAFCRPLADWLAGRPAPYEALEGWAVPTREATRRGAGWPPGLGDSGWSNRVGWDEGSPLLMALPPRGLIPGFGGGPARAKGPPLAETVFASRQRPHPGCLSGGQPALGPSVCEKGFEGQTAPTRWGQCYRARVLGPPKRHSHPPWSTRMRRGLAGGRQLVATVDAKVHHTLRLRRERPHALSGFQARLAAKMALPTVCLWLNAPRGRPHLACTDVVDWSHAPISHQTF